MLTSKDTRILKSAGWESYNTTSIIDGHTIQMFDKGAFRITRDAVEAQDLMNEAHDFNGPYIDNYETASGDYILVCDDETYFIVPTLQKCFDILRSEFGVDYRDTFDPVSGWIKASTRKAKRSVTASAKSDGPIRKSQVVKDVQEYIIDAINNAVGRETGLSVVCAFYSSVDATGSHAEYHVHLQSKNMVHMYINVSYEYDGSRWNLSQKYQDGTAVNELLSDFDMEIL